MPHQCTGCGERFEDGSKEMLSGCPECGGNKFQFRPTGAEFPDDPEPPEPESPESGPADGENGGVAETVGRATTRLRDAVASSDDPDPNASWPSETLADDPETDDGEIIDADARRLDEGDAEDDAQASARSGLATPDDVPSGDDTSAPDSTAVSSTGSTASTTGEADADGGTDAGPARGAGRDTDPTGEAPRHDRPPGGEGDRVVSEPSEADPDITELREQLNDQFESIKIVEPGEYELNLMELYDREEYIIALQENGRYVIQVPDQWIGSDLDDR